MGKGDKKSRRGKIIIGTYGVRRRRKKHSKPHDIAPVKKKEIPKKIIEKAEPVKEELVVAEVPQTKATKPKTKPKDILPQEPEKKSEKTEKTEKVEKPVKAKETEKAKKTKKPGKAEKSEKPKKTVKTKSTAKPKAKPVKAKPGKKASKKK